MEKTYFFTHERAKEDVKRLLDLSRALLRVYNDNYDSISDTFEYLERVTAEIKDYFFLFREDIAETAIITDEHTALELDNDGYTVIAIREERINEMWTRTAEPIDIEQYI